MCARLIGVQFQSSTIFVPAVILAFYTGTRLVNSCYSNDCASHRGCILCKCRSCTDILRISDRGQCRKGLWPESKDDLSKPFSALERSLQILFYKYISHIFSFETHRKWKRKMRNLNKYLTRTTRFVLEIWMKKMRMYAYVLFCWHLNQECWFKFIWLHFR